MKDSAFEAFERPIEGQEGELAPEANAFEVALILAQKLLGYGQPGVSPEDVNRKQTYIEEAEALLTSANLKDAEVRRILQEGIRHAKEA